MQELEPKLQGGLIREGGRICGILRYTRLDITLLHKHTGIQGYLHVEVKCSKSRRYKFNVLMG